jgi:hypothetical protein
MAHFVGLDVSQKMTAICVVDNAGRRLCSTSNAISSQQKRTEPLGHRRKYGVKSSPRREPGASAALLRAQFGNVTKTQPCQKGQLEPI